MMHYIGYEAFVRAKHIKKKQNIERRFGTSKMHLSRLPKTGLTTFLVLNLFYSFTVIINGLFQRKL